MAVLRPISGKFDCAFFVDPVILVLVCQYAYVRRKTSGVSVTLCGGSPVRVSHWGSRGQPWGLSLYVWDWAAPCGANPCSSAMIPSFGYNASMWRACILRRSRRS